MNVEKWAAFLFNFTLQKFYFISLGYNFDLISASTFHVRFTCQDETQRDQTLSIWIIPFVSVFFYFCSLLFCSFAVLWFRLCMLFFALFFLLFLFDFRLTNEKTVRPSTVHKLITARRVRDWSEVHKIRLSWRRCTLWYRRNTHQYSDSSETYS